MSGTEDGKTYYDDCTWVLEKPYGGINLIIKVMDFMTIANRVAIGGLIVAFMIWLFGIRKIRRGPRWKKIILWVILILIALISILILLAKAYTASMGG